MKKLAASLIAIAMCISQTTTLMAQEVTFQQESTESSPGQYVENIPEQDEWDPDQFINESDYFQETSVDLFKNITFHSTAPKSYSEVSAKYERVFRLYNPNTSEHFYTRDENERNALIRGGWIDEKVSWYSLKADDPLAEPVYRLYNPNAQDHHYTREENEKNVLVQLGWILEGIGWYAQKGTSGKPIYRAYNPNAKAAGAHHFSRSDNEYNALEKQGWIQEGLSFYVPKVNTIEMENGQKVWYDETGTPSYGEAYYDGDWYYFDSATKREIKDAFVKVPNVEQARYYGGQGKALYGNQKIGNNVYIFDNSTGYLIYNCSDTVFGENATSNVVAKIDKAGTMRMYDKAGNPIRGDVRVNNVVYSADNNGVVVRTQVYNVPRYFQTDPRWGNVWFGDTTFRHIGCVPTVLAMAYEGLNNRAYSPLDIGYALASVGKMNGTFGNGIPIGTEGDGVMWAAEHYGIQARGDYLDQMEITKILKAGGFVSFTLNARSQLNPDTRYDHEILLYGYENGHVQVHDPLYVNNNRTIDLDTIMRCNAEYEPGKVNLTWGYLRDDVHVEIEW